MAIHFLRGALAEPGCRASHILRFGAYGWDTIVVYGARSFDEAVDEAMSAANQKWPGLFTTYDALAAEDPRQPDESDDDYYERVTTDLTCTNDGSAFIPSWEWAVYEVTADDDVRSMITEILNNTTEVSWGTF